MSTPSCQATLVGSGAGGVGCEAGTVGGGVGLACPDEGRVGLAGAVGATVGFAGALVAVAWATGCTEVAVAAATPGVDVAGLVPNDGSNRVNASAPTPATISSATTTASGPVERCRVSAARGS